MDKHFEHKNSKPSKMLNKEQALSILELQPLVSLHDEENKTMVRRAYFRLAKSNHPDKGGSTEAFQKLHEAYQFLMNNCSFISDENSGDRSSKSDEHKKKAASDEEEGSRYYYYDEHGYDYECECEYESEDEYSSFDDYAYIFGSYFRSEMHDDFSYENFESWEDQYKAQKAWRKEQRKHDYRDEQTTDVTRDLCMFCGHREAIQQRSAKSNGLNWEEYNRRVPGFPQYRTCWTCKTNHVSVLTFNQALAKFAKKLDFQKTSLRTGNPYYPVFWNLQLKGRTFHHKPKAEGRNNEYYWYPDLEGEALRYGWKPRGKAKDEVPWKSRIKVGSLTVSANKEKKTQSNPAFSNCDSPKRNKKRKFIVVSP